MSEIAGSVADPDPHRNRRLIAILVGAVLLPTAVLSYLAVDFVHRLATARRQTEMRRAEAILSYIQKGLSHAGEYRVREAARIVGTERLLYGSQEAVRLALIERGLSEPMFDLLHISGLRSAGEAAGAEQMPWIDENGRMAGMLLFKFVPSYVRGPLVREYFEKEFQDPPHGLVVRVSQPGGSVVYENAPTPNGNFEVTREMGMMNDPSFNGLKLSLRYRDRSIEQDVRAWKARMLGLIGFMDLVLVAGLFLAYRSVQGGWRLSAAAP